MSTCLMQQNFGFGTPNRSSMNKRYDHIVVGAGSAGAQSWRLVYRKTVTGRSSFSRPERTIPRRSECPIR